MERLECLKKAEGIVSGDRYGSPEDNFMRIASLWSSYLRARFGYPIILKPKDVAALMALLKVGRIAGNTANEDSWVDIAGYAACGAELDSAELVEVSNDSVH